MEPTNQGAGKEVAKLEPNGFLPYCDYIPAPNPRVMRLLFLALVVVAIFFPHFILRPVDRALDIFFDWVARSKKEDGTAE